MTAIRCSLVLEAPSSMRGISVLLFAASLRPTSTLSLPLAEPVVEIVGAPAGRRPSRVKAATPKRSVLRAAVEFDRAPVPWCLGVAAVRSRSGRAEATDTADRLRVALSDLVQEESIDWSVTGDQHDPVREPSPDSPLGELTRGPFHVVLRRLVGDDRLDGVRRWEQVQRFLDPARSTTTAIRPSPDRTRPDTTSSTPPSTDRVRPKTDAIDASACAVGLVRANAVAVEMPIDLRFPVRQPDTFRLQGRIRSEAVETAPPTATHTPRPPRSRNATTRRR